MMLIPYNFFSEVCSRKSTLSITKGSLTIRTSSFCKASDNHLVGKASAFLCMLFLFFIATHCHAAATSNQKFPHFKAIAKNVAFWEKIYSKYSLNEAVIHDTEDLSKVYEIIPLLGDDLPGANHFNSVFQQLAKEKYRVILQKLTTQKPTTRDEKRVAALFSGKNRQAELAMAVDNVRSQRGQKERFLNGVIHSGRYMKEIKQIFRAYHLPEELAYLPHVESSFNFKAYSKYGAAGIWQFTHTTGKQYLTIDNIIDERLDPILATHAAAKYLKNSYSTLNDWPLALTSYNYGLSGMLRAVKDEGNYERVFNNYNKGYFKFASRNFYSEFLAALKVAKEIEANPKIRIDSAQSTRYLNLSGYLPIQDVSKHFGVSTEVIQSLNPALLSSVIKGEKHIPKGYVIRLPVGKIGNQRITSIPTKLYNKRQKPSRYHRVQTGDTAGSIARQHGISLTKLIKANNLDKDATIYVKQKLRIPASEKDVTQKDQDNKSSPHTNV